MNTLKEYIEEFLLTEAAADAAVMDEIKDFLKINYGATNGYKIKARPDKDGLYVVNAKSLKLKANATSLTNGKFKFGKVDYLYCSESCLVNLIGAPEECVFIDCDKCNELISLEGSPKKCNTMNVTCCNSLKNLIGAPEECKTFYCWECGSLESLEGAPKKCDSFNCRQCTNLKSVEGAPEKVIFFDCSGCTAIDTLKGFPKEVYELKLPYQISHTELKKKCKIDSVKIDDDPNNAYPTDLSAWHDSLVRRWN